VTTVTTRLPAALSSARQARELVAAALTEGGFHDQGLVDRLILMTSEVVTNAIVHARTEIEIRVRLEDDVIWVEVLDGASRRPRRRHPSATDTGGRGLLLVDALADAWGVADADGDGKKVWIRIDRP
jgi:anti-sigma regulatory factor (Ser/Thr protein kinase)